jgi:hypothetical protein
MGKGLKLEEEEEEESREREGTVWTINGTEHYH